MFDYLKKLLEYAPLGKRLVYDKKQPSKGPSGVEQAELTPEAAKRLATLRESVADDYRKHLEYYEDAVLDFLSTEAAEKYSPGEWKEWNVKLLEHMGYQVSLEDSKGIITHLQEYLKKSNSGVIVDGKFGPNLKQALNKYYDNLERETGWVEGKTKAVFEAGHDTYYLMHDGYWVTADHHPVDIRSKLPLMAEGGKTNERGFYVVKNVDGNTYYIDRWGNTYKNFMPPEDGPGHVAEGVPVVMDPFMEQGEDPRKKAKRFLVNAETGGGNEEFYRFPNGTFLDAAGNKVAAKDIVPRIARSVAKEKDNPEKKVYGVDTGGGKIVYYNEEGVEIETEEVSAEPTSPPKVPSTPSPAAPPKPEKPEEPEVPEPKKQEARPKAYELISQGKVEDSFRITSGDLVHRTTDGEWINENGDELGLPVIFASLEGAKKLAGYYKVDSISGYTVYIKETDGTIHQGIEIDRGKSIAERYAELERKREEKVEVPPEVKQEDIAATYQAREEDGSPKKDELYYRLKDGRWVNAANEEIPLKELLPIIAATSKPINDVYRVEDINGKKSYYNIEGEEVFGTPADAVA